MYYVNHLVGPHRWSKSESHRGYPDKAKAIDFARELEEHGNSARVVNSTGTVVWTWRKGELPDVPKVKKSYVEFDTRRFRASHGVEPRGVGTWAFFFSAVEQDDVMRAWFAPSNTSYAAAKKLAVDELNHRVVANGRHVIYVGP